MDDGGHHEQEAMLEESYERHKGYTQNSDDEMAQRVHYRELDGSESRNTNNNNNNNNNHNNNNNNNNNSRENSSEYSPEIRVPSEPPPKPPNVTQYYVESRRAQAQQDHPNMQNTEIDQMLREQYKELGKKESQAIKRKVKELKQNFRNDLELYKRHNPDFDDKKWYGEASKSNKNKNKSKKSGGRKRRGGNKGSDSDDGGGGGTGGGGTRRRNEPKSFLMNSFEEADSDEEFGEPASKRRRKNRSGGGGGNNNDKDDGEENTMLSFLSSIEKGRSGKRRRKREDGENLVLEDDVLQSMKDLCNDMRKASGLDWKCNIDKRPATHTTRLVEHVSQQLSKKSLHQTFIEDENCYILDCIRDWIHPLPDGSLPPIKVRTEMYRILNSVELVLSVVLYCFVCARIWCFVILLFCYFVILLFCYFVILLFYCFIILLFRCFVLFLLFLSLNYIKWVHVVNI